ncbi:MAG: hypothetical protein IGS03_19300 [Candidatus Sericytochromatia bacterium]|nr:hypothetical protein [Candidatus Sericytochromatia bacterium]
MALIYAFMGPLWLAFGVSLGATLLARWQKLPGLLQAALPLLGFSLAYQLGWGQIHQQFWPPWPPLDSGHWLLWLLWPVTALALVLQLRPRWTFWLHVFLSGLVLGLIWLIATPLREHSWTGAIGWLIMGAAAGIWLLLIWGYKQLQFADAETPQLGLLWNWWLLALASGWFCLLGSSALLAQLNWLVAAALLPPVLLSRQAAAAQGLPYLLRYLVPGLWLQLMLFAELPPAALLALALPLLSGWLQGQIKTRPRWQQNLWLWLFSGVWLLAVAGFSWWLMPRPELYLG